MDEELKKVLSTLKEKMESGEIISDVPGMEKKTLKNKYEFLGKIAESLTDKDNRAHIARTLDFTTMVLSEYAVNCLHMGLSKDEVGKSIGGILTQVDKTVTKNALEFEEFKAEALKKMGLGGKKEKL